MISCCIQRRLGNSTITTPRASRFWTITPSFACGYRRRTGAFSDLSEIWLEGDHYKWRAMRANGVDERYCTGTATPYEKFLAWARTVPATLRNPLYHWTHLELKRYFGIDELLDERAAESIWEQSECLAGHARTVRAQSILRKFQRARAMHHRRSHATTLLITRKSQRPDPASVCIRHFGPTKRCRCTRRANSMPGSSAWPQPATVRS